MDMIGKANSGKPVFSGPEDLGMTRDATQSTQSPEPPVASTQLQRSGQDKSSLPTPDSQVL